ncbi:MAG: M48 family metalloprotease [Burkholderiales bacterium]|nr:M48 family metalloprotease [Burkholderiales bacterium]
MFDRRLSAGRRRRGACVLPAVLAVALAVAPLEAAPPAAAQNLPDLGEASQADFSPAEERRIGEAIMRDIRRDPAYVADPEVSAYVQRLGDRLAGAYASGTQSFEFFVVRDPQVNAFALPGGHVGLHTGLLLTAQTESELASVVAHEIAHVVQRHMARMVTKQSQLQLASMAALALALLAARSSPQVAQAAAVASQAAPLQAALSYSRDFEREADRVGFQMLESAGYDVQGAPDFFERLQRSSRLYENNAPGYLRSHPVTLERIADMQNRAQEARLRQHVDSIEFGLVRAKLRAEAGRPEEAVAHFSERLRERRFTSEQAARYGYAAALLRANDFGAAAAEAERVRLAGLHHPMVETLAARIKGAAGDHAGAVALLASASARYPQNLGVGYGYVTALQAAGRHREAVEALAEIVRRDPRNPKAYELRARSFAALGMRTEQHRMLAEVYLLQGSVPAAIEQLQLAQRAGDADFFVLSAVDARLRELRRVRDEALRARK